MAVFRLLSRSLDFCRGWDKLFRGAVRTTPLYTTDAGAPGGEVSERPLLGETSPWETTDVGALEGAASERPLLGETPPQRGWIDRTPSYDLRERKWTRRSRRTGLVTIKLGMTQMWDKRGTSLATTVLQVSITSRNLV